MNLLSAFPISDSEKKKCKMNAEQNGKYKNHTHRQRKYHRKKVKSRGFVYQTHLGWNITTAVVKNVERKIISQVLPVVQFQFSVSLCPYPVLAIVKMLICTFNQTSVFLFPFFLSLSFSLNGMANFSSRCRRIFDRIPYRFFLALLTGLLFTLIFSKIACDDETSAFAYDVHLTQFHILPSKIGQRVCIKMR